MTHFCTYFDAAYIWKGLALYESLLATGSPFCLHVMALDDKTYEFLLGHQSNSLHVERLSVIETPELLRLKQERTRAEYCWTCGPSIILHFLTSLGLPSITYLDADLMFFSDFSSIYDRAPHASVIITPQYSNRDDLAGRYCVQFLYFRNDASGRACLEWWRDRCLEWCYARYEDGKYGDQKYLDSFPTLFSNVVVTSDRGIGVAPWNMHLYDYRDGMVIHQDTASPLIFYHFHGLRMQTEGTTLIVQLTDCPYSAAYARLFFTPYMQLVAHTLQRYFHISIASYRLKRQSHLSRLYARLKSLLRHNTLVQRLYFRFHRHQGWEQNKL